MKSVSAKYILGFISVVVLGATVSSAQSKRVDVKFRPGSSGGTYANAVTGLIRERKKWFESDDWMNQL